MDQRLIELVFIIIDNISTQFEIEFRIETLLVMPKINIILITVITDKLVMFENMVFLCYF